MAVYDHNQSPGGGSRRRSVTSRRIQSVVAAIILLVLLAGRMFVGTLPPEGVLRRWAGPALAFIVFGALTFKVSIEAWREWHGTGNDPFERSVLARRTAERLRLALPALTISAWGLLIGAVIAAAFMADGSTDLRFVDGPAEGILVASAAAAAVAACVFGILAYTASRWLWPRFLLPARERRSEKHSGHSED